MNGTSNNRDFTRSSITMPARYRTPHGITGTGEATDVSVKGAFIAADLKLPIGAEVDVTLVLDGGLEKIEVHAHGSVARITREGVAIEFSYTDPESLEHLHNLVLFNAEDPEAADTEISDSLGLKRLRDL